MEGLSIQELERLYARYGESVLHRCRQLLRHEDASWDAMHQTFVRAIRYRESFRQQSTARTWLFSIAHRVCMDEIKRRGREPVGIDPDTLDAVLEGLARSHEERLLQTSTVADLLSACAPNLREVVVLRYFEELEVKEIAERTGLSERTVARRLQQFLSRARRQLREPRP